MNTSSISVITSRHRQSIRLRGYDYSRRGMYFITICINDKSKLSFGEIDSAPRMVLNEFGKIADEWISIIPKRFKNIKIDTYVIMPDHVHMIIDINRISGIGGFCGVGGFRVGAIHELPLHSERELPLHSERELPLHSERELPLHSASHIDPHVKSGIESSIRNTPNPYPHNDSTVDSETIRKQRRIMTMPKIVGFYRMNVAKRINELRKAPGIPVWQRNYYERIIRDKNALFRIRQYIKNNPKNWEIENNISNGSIHELTRQ